MNGTTFASITLAMVFLVPSFGQGKKKTPQYKKNNRDHITQLAQGETRKGVDYFESVLRKNPKDLESRYALALGHATLGNSASALEHLQAGLEGGLSPGRFLAGPRSLNRDLLALPGARERLGKQPLVHGPLLGDLRPDGVRVWVRTEAASEVEVRAGGQSFITKTRSEDDFTGVVVIDGLRPGTHTRGEVPLVVELNQP